MRKRNTNNQKVMGWEIAQEKNTQTFRERLRINHNEIKAMLIAVVVLTAVFILGCWLAGNPFAGTSRIASRAVTEIDSALAGNNWQVVWSVVVLAIVFEFLDSAAGMGYGTAFTPILLMLGYEPMQIVPVIMIQQACAGLTSAYVHKEYGNIEWSLKPMSETTKLWLIIAITGSLAVIFSITSIYGILKLGKFWIKLYVAILLLGMGVISLIHAKRAQNYHPGMMYFYGALAGFNKGIGGGGYGPVVTVGGLLAGVPAKSMLAVTALSEGTVCVVSIIVWFVLLKNGVNIDFVLLPSMMLGSIIAVVFAPYVVRVLPEKLWRNFVPVYCCLIGIYSLYKILATL